MSLLAIMDIAKTSLAATRQVLRVTSHNIANVNTPGYSRQEAVLTENRPQNALAGQIGTGVSVEQIRRSVDQFIETQLNASHARLGRHELFASSLRQVQALIAETDQHGIGPALNQLFDAVQDVATNPSDPTARTVLISRGTILVETLNHTRSQLTQNRTSLDQEIALLLSDANRLADEIADLNGRIVDAENQGQNANDYRDQRQLKLHELSEKIAITTLANQDGSVSVFVGQGQVIVDGGVTRDLVAVASPVTGFKDIGYDTGGTVPQSITSLISGGRLKGLLDARDQTIPDLAASLDKLAATLTNEFNQIHRLGYGLDGTTGNDFFGPLSVTATANTTNIGTATIGAGAITANSLLTMDRYEIRFSSATNYSIVNTDTGATIKGNYTGTAITPPTVDNPINIITGTNDTLNVTVDGTPSGVITLTGAASPGLAYTSGDDLAQELQTQINADAALSAAGRSVTVVFDKTTNRFIITSNGTSSSSAVDVTGGTAQATLGLAAGTSTAASGSFVSPQTFNLDGISVTLTGTTAAGDVYTVDSFTRGSETISVTLTDPNKVAASSTLSGVPLNNANALLLSDLKERSLEPLGNLTFSGYFSSTAASFGSTVKKAENDLRLQEFLHEQLQAFRAETSAVSLDEELVKMIEFQKTFEAAARMIIMADELFETLLSMKR